MPEGTAQIRWVAAQDVQVGQRIVLMHGLERVDFVAEGYEEDTVVLTTERANGTLTAHPMGRTRTVAVIA